MLTITELKLALELNQVELIKQLNTDPKNHRLLELIINKGMLQQLLVEALELQLQQSKVA